MGSTCTLACSRHLVDWGWSSSSLKKYYTKPPFMVFVNAFFFKMTKNVGKQLSMFPSLLMIRGKSNFGAYFCLTSEHFIGRSAPEVGFNMYLLWLP